RSEGSSEAVIEDLPGGHIPGGAALGFPAGGGVWALSGVQLAETLRRLPFFDRQKHAIPSSLALGEIGSLRSARAGVPMHILPMIGAVETRSTLGSKNPSWYGQMKTVAAELDIAPFVHGGGPAWYAISALGSHLERVSRSLTVPLPAQHPFSTVQ